MSGKILARANIYLIILFFPFQLDLCACSETWITPQVDRSSLQISGYNIITDNRTFSTGGGVALYLKSSFEYHLRNDLKIAGVAYWRYL